MKNDNDESKEATLLWDEYKYRHEHCWATMFRLTSAAVLLGVVPYIAPKDLQWRVLLVPAILSVALILISFFRMHSELALLRQIRKQHRDRQKALYPNSSSQRQGRPDRLISKCGSTWELFSF